MSFRTRIPRALRRRTKENATAGPPPLLSVIVPTYNVEAYLAEAVNSLVDQTYPNIEIIVVDDGSTDDSGVIADRLADDHANVQVIHQENGGLGHARNTGARAARGEYIAFVDSDDIVPPGAYKTMLGVVRKTGSDFVTGNAERFTGSRTWPAWNQAISHRREARRTTIHKTPELLYDTQAWNKVFRKDFYDRIEVQWVEGRLYEDMFPVQRAYFAAEAVDVVHDVIYRWRSRDEFDSITQRRRDLRNLVDKIEMVDRGAVLVEESGDAALRELFVQKLFDGDLFAYRQWLGQDLAFDEAFVSAVRRHWPRDGEMHVLDSMWLERRVFYASIVEHGLDEALRAWQWVRENRFRLPTVIRDGRLTVDLERLDPEAPVLPESIWVIEAESQLNCTVTDVRWTGTRLVITGWAYIPNDEHLEQQVVRVVAGRGDRSFAFEVERHDTPYASRYAASELRSHACTGFTASLDVEHLPAWTDDLERTTRLPLQVEVERAGLVRKGPVAKVWRGGSIHSLVARHTSNDLRVHVVGRAGDPLVVAVGRAGITASTASLVDRQLTVELSETSAAQVVEAWLEHDTSGARTDVEMDSSDGRVTVSAELRDVGDRGWVTRYLKVKTMTGSVHRVELSMGATTSTESPDTALWLGRTGWGLLTVTDRPRVVEVDEVELVPGAVILRGTAAPGVSIDVGRKQLRHTTEVWVTARRDGRTFEVEVPMSSGDDEAPLKSGTYKFVVRATDARASHRYDWLLRSSVEGAAHAPFRRVFDDHAIQVNLTGSRELHFWSEPPLEPDERSKHCQVERAAASRRLPIQEAVFCTTYFGFEASDSPEAIHHEIRRRFPELPVYWGVVDRSVVVPEGGTPVVMMSQEWHEAIATSRFLVNNVGSIMQGYKRRPDQVDVQTWHGTPLKIVGHSLLNQQGKDDSELIREGAQWDLLVSQSPYYSDVVAREFCTRAEVIESGYPRNDEVVRADAGRIAALRSMLGIPEGDKVVLYAPTWRDNLKSGWSAKFFEALDLERLAKDLGENWTVLLRGHGFNARAGDPSRSSGQVIDVTQHPRINDLYLVADALVTDYSSVMFDFCVTGRPIIFYTPDLESYLAQRPTYVDLLEIAPGPVVRDQSALRDALADLDRTVEDHAAAYASFVERFAPWDDGRAAERVVDAMLRKRDEKTTAAASEFSRGFHQTALHHLQDAPEFATLADVVRKGADGRPVIYVPNVGNWGDALIHQGVLRFLEREEIDYVISWRKYWSTLGKRHPEVDTSKSLMLMSAGGAWCENWSHGRDAVEELAPSVARTIVLPSTYELGPANVPDGHEITYFARDTSLSRAANPDATFCHDMAFYLDLDLDLPLPAQTRRSYLREDKEASPQQHRGLADAGSFDISRLRTAGDPVEPFFQIVAGSRQVRTDRLHVAIAGAMLGLDVELLGGSYPKARAIFDSSIAPHFPQVRYLEWPTPAE